MAFVVVEVDVVAADVVGAFAGGDGDDADCGERRVDGGRCVDAVWKTNSIGGRRGRRDIVKIGLCFSRFTIRYKASNNQRVTHEHSNSTNLRNWKWNKQAIHDDLLLQNLQANN